MKTLDELIDNGISNGHPYPISGFLRNFKNGNIEEDEMITEIRCLCEVYAHNRVMMHINSMQAQVELNDRLVQGREEIKIEDAGVAITTLLHEEVEYIAIKDLLAYLKHNFSDSNNAAIHFLIKEMVKIKNDKII